MVIIIPPLSKEEQPMILKNIISYMREYQRIHNIKKKCVTNTQYIYDILSNCPYIDEKEKKEIKAKALIVAILDENNNIFGLCPHVVLIWEENIIDTSYEIFSLPNTHYYDNIGCILKNIPIEAKSKQSLLFENVLKNMVGLIKTVEKINNGTFIVEKEYYNKQAVYVEEKLNDLISNTIFLKQT